jgi:hypothetical protein
MTEREVAWIEEQLADASTLTPGQIAAAARLLLIAREEQDEDNICQHGWKAHFVYVPRKVAA